MQTDVLGEIIIRAPRAVAYAFAVDPDRPSTDAP
jgi:hypothetical protein